MSSGDESAPLLEKKKAVFTGPALLIGWGAVVPEFIVIAICTAVTVYVGLQDDIDYRFYVELGTIALGVVGIITELVFCPKDFVGAPRNYTDTGVYLTTLAAMGGADYFVRSWRGGSKLRILSNWAVLIGSASSQNLTCPPGLSRASIESGNSIFAFVAYEVFELWVSLFGTKDFASAGLQFLFRRIVLWTLEALIALWNYGWVGNAMFAKGAISMFQVAQYSVFEPYGDGSNMLETDELEISCVGKFLLGFPIYSGVLTPVRFFDGTVFCEQIVSFSSPTSIVGPRIARGHCHYCHFIVQKVRGIFGKHQDPAFRELRNRDSFKVVLREWCVGNRRGAARTIAPENISDPVNNVIALIEGSDENVESQADLDKTPALLVGDKEVVVDSTGRATQLLEPVKVMRDQKYFYAK